MSDTLQSPPLSSSRYLVGDGVCARRGAGDVVEAVGDSGVLHDVTGVDDVRTGGRDLDLDLVADARRLGEEAHPGQELSDFICRLAVGGTEGGRDDVKEVW